MKFINIQIDMIMSLLLIEIPSLLGKKRNTVRHCLE